MPVRLSLSTVGSTSCRIEIDAELLLVQVSTGGSPVWSTEQCPGAVPEQTVVLRPGWTSALDVVWPGIYGDRGCTGTTKVASPGAYAVEAAVYEGEPSRADFDLEAAAPPEHEGDGPRGGQGQATLPTTSRPTTPATAQAMPALMPVRTRTPMTPGRRLRLRLGGSGQGGIDYGGEDDASTGNHVGDSADE